MGRQSLIVLDTHALVWWVSGSPRFSARARREVDGALRLGPAVASAISLFEVATAVRRRRLDLGLPLYEWLAQLLRIAQLRLEPVDARIAQIAGDLPQEVPGDPADRLIVATAVALGARLVTADAKLRRLAQVESVW